MKIFFPGPKVQGIARTLPGMYGALGVSVQPGENEIEDAIAERLIAMGQVTRVEQLPVAEPEIPKAEEREQRPITRRARRSAWKE